MGLIFKITGKKRKQANLNAYVNDPNQFRFRTTFNGTITWPIVMPIAQSVVWNWGDGSPEETTIGANPAPSKTYTSSDEKLVTVTFANISGFNGFSWSNTRFIKEIDFLNCINLFFCICNSTQMTSVIMPTALNGVVTTWDFTSTNVPIWDFRTIKFSSAAAGATIKLDGNSSLTQIISPTGTGWGRCAVFYTFNCNMLNGMLDLSGFDFNVATASFGADIRIDGCHQLDNINLIGSTGFISNFNSSNNFQLAAAHFGTLAFRNNATNVGATISFVNCTSLTTINISGCIGRISSFDARSTTSYSGAVNFSTVAFRDDAVGSLVYFSGSTLNSLVFNATPASNERIDNFQAINCLGLTTITFPFLTRTGIYVNSSFNLTSFTFTNPSTSMQLGEFIAYDCNISGTFDISKVQNGFGGNVGFWSKTPLFVGFSANDQGNNNLTGITFHPTFSTSSSLQLNAADCNLTGTLNLSMFEFFHGNQIFGNNSAASGNVNLTQVTYSATAKGDMEIIRFTWCNITGTLDLRWLHRVCRPSIGTNRRGNVSLAFNPNMTSILWPDMASNAEWSIWLRGAGMEWSSDMRNDTLGVSSIDLRTIKGCGTVWVHNCPNITSFYGWKETLDDLDGETLGRTALNILNNPILDTFQVNNLNTKIAVVNIATTRLATSFVMPVGPQSALMTTNTVTNSQATSIDMSAFTNFVNPSQRVYNNNPNLTTFSIGDLDATYGITLAGCTSLSDLNVPAIWDHTITTTFETVNVSNSVLTAQSIDELLVRINNSIGTVTLGAKIISAAGANAAPTNGSITGFDGIAAKASLITKGITVTTN